MRTLATRARAINQYNGLGNQLWDLAGNRPSLDLRFAENKSLVDATTGQNLVTFTRASSGTYVDSTGTIRTATTNLRIGSENIVTPGYAATNSTLTLVTAASPIPGLNTVTKFALNNGANTGNSSDGFNFTSTNLVNSEVYTQSIFVKSDGANTLRLRSNVTGQVFDIPVAGPAPAPTGTITAVSFTPVGDGWSRISWRFTTTTTAPGNRMDHWAIKCEVNDGVGGLLITGAQLEQSSTVGEYIPTTSTINSAPRFDHNPTTGESLGLLVEEQRTNLLTWSEDASQWLTPGTGITISQNQTTAPTGALTADQYSETATTGLHVQDSSAFVFVTGTTYTYSVYVKPIGGRNFEIGYPPTIFTARFARFSLSGGGSVQGTDAGVTASIQAAGNGWYRCSASSTCAVGAGSRIGNFINNDSFSRNYTGDVSTGLFIWGAQLEAGAFPTSYIPTTTAAATRSADVASISGSNFSSWYRQDSGSWYCSANSLVFDSNERGLFGIDTGNFARGYHASANSPTRIRTRRRDATVTLGIDATATAQTSARIALVATSTEHATTYNGGDVQTNATALTLDPITDLRIGYQNITGTAANVYLCGCISRLTYWPARLPSSTLQAITQ